MKIVLVGVLALAMMPAAQPASAQPRADDHTLRLLQWLDAVQRHTPGRVDAAAIEVAGFPSAQLVKVAADLKKTIPGNETVVRGAVLHADIAMFVGGRRPAADGSATSSRQYGAHDGREDGVRHRTAHWRIARLVLDAVMPTPSADAGVLLWYRAVSAYLLAEGEFPDARDHLARAREMFPASPVFLLDSAYLHQKYSSPGTQAAVQEWRAKGVYLDVESRKNELERAERFLRQALALAPTDGEILLRLGHTLAELGRHEEAASELRRAIGSSLDRERRYLAELFLGGAEQALGRKEEAKVRYRNAAELYPNSQSPHLALAHLARQEGNRAGALRMLRPVAARSPSGHDPIDPWWNFYQPHVKDAWPLMRRVWKLAESRAR